MSWRHDLYAETQRPHPVSLSLRPTHTLVLAGATTMLHLALATVGPTLLGITAKPGAGHVMTTGLGALVALGVSSLMYAQRRRSFRANQVTRRALSSLQDDLRRYTIVAISMRDKAGAISEKVAAVLASRAPTHAADACLGAF